MNFDEAFHKLLGHEGGFSDHPNDTGKATMWGVTERVARADGYEGHMLNFPLDHAKRIYRKQYWDKIRAEELPPALRYAVFDAAVNSGPPQAIRWLQKAVGVAEDGIVGPQTLMAARAANPDFAIRRMLGIRLAFMASLGNWPAFSRGWARRIADVLQA